MINPVENKQLPVKLTKWQKQVKNVKNFWLKVIHVLQPSSGEIIILNPVENKQLPVNLTKWQKQVQNLKKLQPKIIHVFQCSPGFIKKTYLNATGSPQFQRLVKISLVYLDPRSEKSICVLIIRSAINAGSMIFIESGYASWRDEYQSEFAQASYREKILYVVDFCIKIYVIKGTNDLLWRNMFLIIRFSDNMKPLLTLLYAGSLGLEIVDIFYYVCILEYGKCMIIPGAGKLRKLEFALLLPIMGLKNNTWPPIVLLKEKLWPKIRIIISNFINSIK